MKNTSAWGGRFTSETAELAQQFGASAPFDWRLYRQDIAGSIAHARMLVKQGIISADRESAIEAGLRQTFQEIEQGRFEWSIAREDVHMNVEASLGDAGRALHTARSRNDQVALDLRMWTREAVAQMSGLVLDLQAALLDRARAEAETAMPGFTHLQRAQPVTLGHHLLAYVEMLERDFERFHDAFERINVLPLGSGALAGVPYPIDRAYVAEQLGFGRLSANSLDAVSDRDFVVETLAAAALCGVHLSRLGEELVLWSSAEFSFIEMDDRYSTGSSIMPQKKNPDFAELVRGKSGRVMGSLVTLLVMLKGLPLAYNKDMQEDKEALFDAVDTLSGCLAICRPMVETLHVHRGRLAEAAAGGYSTATDLADYLVRKGLPFRDAHRTVGELVAACADSGRQLDEMTLADLQQRSQLFDEDALTVITVEASLAARDVPGGTAPARVHLALDDAEGRLAVNRERLEEIETLTRRPAVLLEVAAAP